MKMKLISTIHIYTGQRSYRQYREKQTCYVDDNLTTSHFIEETTNQKLGMLTCKSFRQKRCKWSCAEERKHVYTCSAVQRTIDRYLLSKTPSKWSTGGQHKKRYTQNSVTVYIAYPKYKIAVYSGFDGYRQNWDIEKPAKNYERLHYYAPAP